MVCDGMGGAAGRQHRQHRGGGDLYPHPDGDGALPADMTPERLQEARHGVANANAQYASGPPVDPELPSMGTTLVSALVKGDRRPHQQRRRQPGLSWHGADGLRQISRDHSLVEDMVEKGDLTPGQARSHPRRNLITRALGPDPAVEADGFPLQWKPGNFLLLCSDGLVNTVTDQEIMFEILHSGQPEDCLQRLMAISKQRGAPDNVTAILLMND